MSVSKYSVVAGTALLAGLLSLASGCATDAECASCPASGAASAEPMKDEAQCTAIKPGTVTSVNAVCVMVNEDPVDPAVEPVLWKGQKVGFCCKGCIPKWNALTAAKKDELLAKAITLKPKA